MTLHTINLVFPSTSIRNYSRNPIKVEKFLVSWSCLNLHVLQSSLMRVFFSFFFFNLSLSQMNTSSLCQVLPNQKAQFLVSQIGQSEQPCRVPLTHKLVHTCPYCNSKSIYQNFWLAQIMSAVLSMRNRHYNKKNNTLV